MSNMYIQGTVQTGRGSLDVGITDVLALEYGDQTVIYTTSGVNGGLASFDVTKDGDLQLIDFANYTGSTSLGAFSGLEAVEVDGELNLAVADGEDDRIVMYAISSAGTIGSASTLAGFSSSIGRSGGLHQFDSGTLVVSDTVTDSIALHGSDASDENLAGGMRLRPGLEQETQGVRALEEIELAGQEFILAANTSEPGVSLFRLEAGELIKTAEVGPDQGASIMTPTSVKAAIVGDKAYALVASSPNDGSGDSGAITVLEVSSTGELSVTDHVIDTQDTRFGDVQSIEIIEAEDRHYVAAGGGDDGLTLFVLMPNGDLQIMSTLTDDSGNSLTNVTAIGGLHFDDSLNIYVGTEQSSGLTHVQYSTQQNGALRQSMEGVQVLRGSIENDILVGNSEANIITGRAGNDVIQDGAGKDTLNGGTGSDVFILNSDLAHDIIEDFQPGRDKIDLSRWPMLYNASSLDVTSTATGAIIGWRGETLEINTRDGRSLTEADVAASILETPHRVPDFSAFTHMFGNSEEINEEDSPLDGLPQSNHAPAEPEPETDLVDPTQPGGDAGGSNGSNTGQVASGDPVGNTPASGDSSNSDGSGAPGPQPSKPAPNPGLNISGDNNRNALGGTERDDTISGLDGDDQIIGGEGADIINGNRGNDLLTGGDGDDSIRGERGDDQIIGGDGHDDLIGGFGNDSLAGGNGDDYIDGQSDHDLIRGHRGHDSIYGGDGNDTILGDNNNDFISGGNGNDVLRGGNGNDTIHDDGNGNDRIFGANGEDEIVGGTGDDLIRAGFQADTVYGGEGNDFIVGGGGADVLHGGEGDDVMQGNFNADRFVFANGHGHDKILDFSATNDFERLDFRELSTLNSIADVQSVSVQVGFDVRIETGSSSSIFLKDVHLSDLDAIDFLF